MARKPKHFAKRRVTARDVGLQVGVSAVTVGLALRDDPQISDKTKMRVRDAARQMRYRPQAAATMLAGGKTHTIGIIFARAPQVSQSRPTVTDALMMFAPGLNAIGDILTDRDYLMIVSTWRQPETYEVERFTPLPRIFRESGVDGVIVIRPPVDGALEQTLQDSLLPYVVIDAPPAPGRHAVLIDERRAMEMAVEHLLELGHQRIAFINRGIAPKSLIFNPTRHWLYSQAYLAAMQKAGLDPMQGWDFENLPDEIISKPITDLLELSHPPTAVITYDDHDALSVMSALARHSLSVPNDVSIVTLREREDVSMAIRFAQTFPQLTCKAHLQQQLAATAIDKLMELIDLDQPIDPQHTPEPTVLEPQLIIRESTGPAPAE